MCRACGRIGIHCGDDPSGSIARNDQTNRAHAQHHCRAHHHHSVVPCGAFFRRLFWPFALLAIPCAFIGGYLHLPTTAFQIVLGIVLIFSAFRFLLPQTHEEHSQCPPNATSIPVGAGLGFLAGLTVTGGGIFLTSQLLWKKWAVIKKAAAVSAFFILVNSAAGLAGNYTAPRICPDLFGC